MKRKKHADHANSERWLVSYADLVTLLFALFVILYAESKADVDKLKKVQEGMHEAFDHAEPAPTATPSSASNGAPSAAASPAVAPSGSSPSVADPFISQTRDAIQESLKLETGVADLNDKVQFAEDDRGLIVRLAARDFFDDGVVEARVELRPLLDRIAKVLATVPNAVRVEGHTDIEEENPNQPQGWELSADRAAWVVKYWVKRWGLEPGRLSAAGLSHFHPLTLRKDDYSRGKNRRVEIIILRNTKKPDQPSKTDHSV